MVTNALQYQVTLTRVVFPVHFLTLFSIKFIFFDLIVVTFLFFSWKWSNYETELFLSHFSLLNFPSSLSIKILTGIYFPRLNYIFDEMSWAETGWAIQGHHGPHVIFWYTEEKMLPFIITSFKRNKRKVATIGRNK